MSNLLPLCETHHHLVHEGGWNLSIDTERTVTWIKPDGTVWQTDNGPPRTGRSRGRPHRPGVPPAAGLLDEAS